MGFISLKTKRMKTENITIEGTKYKFRIGLGVMMLFEEKEKKTITEAEGRQDIMKLAFYTLQYNNENFK